MQARYVLFAVLLLLAIVGLIYFVPMGDSPSSENGRASLPQISSESLVTDARNPIAAQKRRLDVEKVDDAFECISPSGIITCGAYQGGEVMYYAALVGSRKRLDEFGKAEIVKAQANTALNVAAALGDIKIVRQIYRMGTAHHAFDGVSVDEHASIHAANSGHVEVLKFFVENGLNVNQKFSDGYSDLFVEGLVGQHPAVIRYLLENGYQLDCDFRFPNGKSYLDVATELELVSVAESIQQECSRSVH